MANRLEGKVAVITGANSGIGKATAKMFAAEGAAVVIGARKLDKTQEVADEIIADGGKAVAVKCDIINEAEIADLCKAAIDEFGKIDIVVANAGKMDHIEGIDKADSELYRAIYEVNVIGTAATIREALKYMKEAGSGVVLMTGSQSGINGGGGAAYVASKAALVGLCKHIAVWGQDRGIRCNMVAPAGVATPLNGPDDIAKFDADFMPALSKHIAGYDPCSAEDVAATFLFLAADESKALNGDCITIDFGYSI